MDDKKLNGSEIAGTTGGALVGTFTGISGSVTAISATGSVSGLSAAGITSGLATIGGGSMVVGFGILAGGTVLLAGIFGYMGFRIMKRRRRW